MQPHRRLRVIRDAHARLRICCDRFLENEDQLFIRQLMLREGRPLRRDAVNRQPHRIEFEFRERLCDRLEAQCRCPAHRAFCKVGRHIELQVQDVHEAVARILASRLVRQRRRQEMTVAAAHRIGFRSEATGLRAEDNRDEGAPKLSDDHTACSCRATAVSIASFFHARRREKERAATSSRPFRDRRHRHLS